MEAAICSSSNTIQASETSTIISDSAEPSPKFAWTKSFDLLIDDAKGINIFEEYMKQKRNEGYLMFWLAVRGFNKKDDSDPKKKDLANIIYRAFINNNGNKPKQFVSLCSETIENINSQIECRNISGAIFNEALSEVEEKLRNSYFPEFLSSGVLSQIQRNGNPQMQEVSSSTPDVLLQPWDSSFPRCVSKRLSQTAVNTDSDFASSQSQTDNDPESVPASNQSSGSHRKSKSRSPHGSKHHSLALFNQATNGHKRSKPEKRPELLASTDPSVFAAVVIARLERHLANERVIAEETHALRLRELREQLNGQLATPDMASHQVSQQTIEEDPSNIIEIHMSRVFTDTDTSTYDPLSPTGPTPCMYPQTHHRVRRSRMDTSSNLSVSSGVDSGCFDASSQFSTDSRESETLTIPHYAPYSEDLRCRTTGRVSQRGVINGRWASISPHRNMAYLTHKRAKSRSNSAERPLSNSGLTIYNPAVPDCACATPLGALPGLVPSSATSAAAGDRRGKKRCSLPVQPYHQQQLHDSMHGVVSQDTPALPPPPSGPNHTESPSSSPTVVAYFFCGETIPYRTTVNLPVIRLIDFKETINRKGNFKYFFKMRSDEIEIGGIVHEEISRDDQILPFFDGKIIGKVEKSTT